MFTRSEDLPGRIIAGYRLLEILGRGGMSIVFLAQRLDDPQDRVAIKILMPSTAPTPEEFVSFQARFMREAQAAYHMHHEHILPVLGYGQEQGLFYMIMPVITGGTLTTRLASASGPLPLAEVARYLDQLAGAIDYANQHGVVHRDIKPSNVLIDTRGSVYLVDFGIIHLFDSGLYALDEAPTSLTTTGRMYGTPAYMAPERFKGDLAEPATDIYSLGILLYQLVTGQVPFSADNPLAVGMKHLNEQPRSPRSLRPDLPEPAEAAILKALAKRPADRFATAAAFASAFDAGLKGQWSEALFPLPPVTPPDLAATQIQHPVIAPVVPVPATPYQPGQMILGPAPLSAYNQGPVAFAPTQFTPAPALPPQTRARSPLLAVATVALVIALLLVSALSIYFIQKANSPNPGNQANPTSTSGVPPTTGTTPTGVPTASPAGSPTASPGQTPTPTPSPSPGTTPSPSPGTTPTTTPGTTPTSTPGTAPTPSPGTLP
jgi:eukaryotic-like serine/threonine-protein kinase